MKAASVFKSCVGGLLSLALCGCVQSTGLGERAIVKSIYMDFRAGSYEAVLTVMDWKPSADAGSAENQPQVYLGRGKTVGQALQKAEDQQSKKPFYGQNDLLFLGQGILQTDITPCLSYFAQENAVRPNLMVFAVRQKRGAVDGAKRTNGENCGAKRLNGRKNTRRAGNFHKFV